MKDTIEENDKMLRRAMIYCITALQIEVVKEHLTKEKRLQSG